MNKKNTLFYSLICFILMTTVACGREYKPVEISLNVQDDGGIPVGGAKVSVTFADGRPINDPEHNYYGATNDNGEDLISGSTRNGVGISIRREGFYRSGSGFGQLQSYMGLEKTIKLRSVKNPISLYAKKVDLTLPVENQFIGYDFRKGDFVSPHGVGVEADIYFKVVIEEQSWKTGKGTLYIKFDEDEGLANVGQERQYPFSELVFPYKADEDGYNIGYLEKEEDGYFHRSTDKSTGYFVRSRVIKDSSGEIISANYAKIPEDFEFDPRSSDVMDARSENRPIEGFGSIVFTYYFNPNPNDRNLEYKPRSNLFTHEEMRGDGAPVSP